VRQDPEPECQRVHAAHVDAGEQRHGARELADDVPVCLANRLDDGHSEVILRLELDRVEHLEA
jgi:hypothetical protein